MFIPKSLFRRLKREKKKRKAEAATGVPEIDPAAYGYAKAGLSAHLFAQITTYIYYSNKNMKEEKFKWCESRTR